MKKRALVLSLAIAAGAAIPALASDVRPLDGAFVLARTGVSASYLWNATPFVAKLVADKVLGDAGMRAIEATAIDTLAERAVRSSAKTLVLKVVYERTGSVSAVYGTPTFAGLENVLTLSADRAALLKNRAVWTKAVQDGSAAKGLAVSVTGKLPAQ